MPWESRWKIDIPTQSLPSFLFTSPTASLNDKPLLIDAEKPEYFLSHTGYREWSKRLAAGLRQAGFQPGDRLLLFSGNTIFFPIVIMGTIMAGGIFTGANPTYVARELAYQLQDSGAKFLITTDASLDTALEAAASIGLSKDRIFVFDDGFATFDGVGRSVNGIQHWSNLLASPEEGSRFSWEQFTTRSQMNQTAALNYSSGTTGVPKGVEITHMNYISNCMQTEHMAALEADYASILQRASVLSFLPMYHAYGQVVHCVTTALKGTPIYIMRKFDFLKMLQYIEKHRITSLNLVPPIAVALAKRSEVLDYDISSIESAGCGAAPLGREPALEFEKRFDNRFPLRQGWGMTELTCSGVGWDPTRAIEGGAIGELNPNIEGMIVDEDGKEVVEEGERGEFLVRGPNVMKAYWRKPEATRDTKTADGWLKTGDVVYRDAEGLIYIVDRKKELIKVKGNQVAPAELEGLLLDHQAIQDVAVVGVTIGGEELPRAYIVLQDGVSATPQEIASWLAERVARHKRLAGGVVITDSIPKNPSGKILRKMLRERAKTEVGDGAVQRQSKL